jgi:hypothetical protein
MAGQHSLEVRNYVAVSLADQLFILPLPPSLPFQLPLNS